jgi:hypothetical protein
MKQSLLLRNILLIVLGFLSVGAFFGGIGFIIRPDGDLFQMPVDILNDSPFVDFLAPGIILLTVFGVFPVFVIVWMIKRPNIPFCEKLNVLNDHHFAWTFSIYIGFALIIWINVQTLIINAVDILHTIYSSLGIVIVCLSLLPDIRNRYKTP